VLARPTKKHEDFMAQYEEFTIDQGSDVSVEISCVNIDGSVKDLSNHTIQAKMKKSYNSDSADTVDFTAGVGVPATDGVILLSLTNSQTDAIKPGRWVYDVEISFVDSDGAVIKERILEGRVQVTPSVTR